jgi:hypothetical protein
MRHDLLFTPLIIDSVFPFFAAESDDALLPFTLAQSVSNILLRSIIEDPSAGHQQAILTELTFFNA